MHISTFYSTFIACMLSLSNNIIRLAIIGICLCLFITTQAQSNKNHFNVIAFYTAKNDQAHISFVKEANNWFPTLAQKNNFGYDTTSNWKNLNSSFLSKYQLVIFLDSRPDDSLQRKAFEKYIKDGGAWLGFHFSAFALTPSAFPQNWDWYHNDFIAAGEYSNNTWRPTYAVLRVEALGHPVTNNLPATFVSAPSEWYNWKNNLQANKNIQILLAIDSSSFPLGTGPKQHEIWHSGYYPVAWTNNNYKMVYMNMGHNDIDYENRTNKTLSHTFSSPEQNKFIENAILWLAGKLTK